MSSGETFADWAEEWMSTAVHLAPSTRSGYQGQLRNRILPAFGDVPVAEITQRGVRRFVAARIEAGDSPGTVQLAYGILRTLLLSALDAGLIEGSPCRRVRLPKVPQYEAHFLDARQVLTLSRAISPAYRVLILFAACTGARAGEIGALRVDRVDLANAQVVLREALVFVEGRPTFGPTKSHTWRAVGLPPFLVEEMAQHLRGQGSDPDDLVFTEPDGEPRRHNAFLGREFKPAVRRSGLAPGLRFHDLRHTCAALLIALGAHPRAIMERLGHSKVDLTLGRYGHLFPSLDAALVDGLDAAYRESLRS
ncbi:MAG TPA: site-specific integrase [Acidimicrobiales bacterium]|nr:site-specific integrase [Acidimicrobiales bacterium]